MNLSLYISIEEAKKLLLEKIQYDQPQLFGNSVASIVEERDDDGMTVGFNINLLGE